MTVAYTLPDGTEFVSTQEEHPLVVTRESAGIVPCDDWTGPIHECAVNEDVVRAMAKEGGARLAVTFTREGETSKDAETGEETKGEDISPRYRSSWRRWCSDRRVSPSACTT